ncbi:MAG: aminoglycoside 3'-phosphotransferase, partial [Chloroflexaceae bacterium]|nr:aminoglycoside 3'-phosphotransferase [Chloroflexaceae bacterium]
MLNEVPPELAAATAGYAWQPVIIGQSGAAVWRLTAAGKPALFLKRAALAEGQAEAERLTWLAGKLPVPHVQLALVGGESFWLLTTALPGVDAATVEQDDLPGLVSLLAEGLQLVHAVAIDDCLFDHRAVQEIERARRNLALGEVDEDDFDEERQGRSAAELFAELLATQPQHDDLVFTHGDYCMPNVLLDGGRLSGFVDMGRAGVGDRYRDLALAARSISRNYGEQWVAPFFAA